MKEIFEDFLFHLFGTDQYGLVLAGLLLIVIGVVLSGYIRAKYLMGKGKTDPSKPKNFKWKILIYDKQSEFFIGILLAAIFVRFKNDFDLISWIPIEGIMPMCFILGLLNFALGEILIRLITWGGATAKNVFSTPKS